MNLVLAKPISRFLLVKALQFTIPLRHSISKMKRDIQEAELERMEQPLQDISKLLHPFIQLPSCYDRNGLLLCLLTVYLTPLVCPFAFVVHNDWNLAQSDMKTSKYG
jgi:hypothetical protein